MATNFPNGVTSQGVPVIPSIPLTTGTYYFVHSVTGADNNSGKDKQHPLATLQAAINKCTANKNDVILLMPGHAETVTATSINLSVAGVQVVGLGRGLLRPTFTHNATASTITVSAATCSVTNCHFLATIANVVTAFLLSTAKDFAVSQCTFVDTATNLNYLCLVTTNATSNAADGLTFNENHVIGQAATDGACISILAVLQRLHICDNTIDKLVTNDAGHLVTFSTFAVTGVRILRNQLTFNALASQATGTMLTGSSTACSGIVADNRVYQIDTTTALLATAGTKLGFSENYVGGVADKSGTLFPAVDDPA